MSKVLDDFSAQYGDQVRVERVDVMQNSELAQKYEVRYVPTLVFEDGNGNILGKEVGYLSLEEIIIKLEEYGITLTSK
ncbi:MULTISPECIES: thioredoxin family protein [Aminobacterium]|jgi:thioredoxin 1|nr:MULTISPECIES: thioredoxin family protein [Aminobacterium]MDD2378601.1 thioredoxin family protein [Aminobacterium colombiense]MDD3768065.1 thioredoxin family protein [Aminobacterium colombiense]MDD4266105.1 thioredoxin family protein [Aminobacterium colombiense]MDD4585255.1 thioredoxin family protein [Aminobacterium colombiense]NLK29834.1 thioredoxin family protein [Aminobacterium colombiense]